jgi:hypothetical protein
MNQVLMKGTIVSSKWGAIAGVKERAIASAVVGSLHWRVARNRPTNAETPSPIFSSVFSKVLVASIVTIAGVTEGAIAS